MNNYRRQFLTVLVGVGALYPTASQASYFGSQAKLEALALPIMGAAILIFMMMFMLVGRAAKNKRQRVVAEYEAELDKFRRSIRGGARR